jgi:hypothetical protein
MSPFPGRVDSGFATTIQNLAWNRLVDSDFLYFSIPETQKPGKSGFIDFNPSRFRRPF